MDTNDRFRAKLAGRALGTVPVFQDEPELAKGDDPEAVDARFRAKLGRHSKPAPIKADSKPAADTKAKAESHDAEEKAKRESVEADPKAASAKSEASNSPRR